MSLNFCLAEVNMQSKAVIYFFLAGTSISNEMPNFQMSKAGGVKPIHSVWKNPYLYWSQTRWVAQAKRSSAFHSA